MFIYKVAESRISNWKVHNMVARVPTKMFAFTVQISNSICYICLGALGP